MEMMPEVTPVLQFEGLLGEGALWDAKRKVVWFVDIKKHHVWHYDPASGSNSRWQAPDQVGWVVNCEDGRLLAGLKEGLYLFDPEASSFDKLCAVPGEPAHNRLNDGCTDPSGACFFGSMDDGEEQATGAFYRFHLGKLDRIGPSGISITNGPAVSANGRKIYMTDTIGKKIMVADIGADGLPGPARLFVDTAKDFPEAYPDGPVCDAEGYVWTGLWNGWHVARYSPQGKLDRKVKIPAANVTKMTFGESDLKTAYVTTARKGLDAAALAQQPLAGSLFSFRSEVAGYAQASVKLA
jgi:sugar lactone lactonase YvrE